MQNISNMSLNLRSNLFKGNKAIEGGALYLSNSNVPTLYQYDIYNAINNENIIIKDNIFNENFAYNFGGAIFSDYDRLYIAQTNNNTLLNNKAGIMGGGIFTPNSVNKTMFDLSHWKLNRQEKSKYNNTDDYATKPSYIKLNNTEFNKIIYSGDTVPLSFSLYNEYDDQIIDITRYYSSMTLKIEIYRFDDFYTIKNNNNFVNNSIIYQKPAHYLEGNVERFSLGNYNNNINEASFVLFCFVF